jgi:hypothetical protein
MGSGGRGLRFSHAPVVLDQASPEVAAERRERIC